MILFCDFETTGINPYACEILTGYFELHDNGKKVDSYEFKSQVDRWDEDAYYIHNIEYETMKSFPQKRIAMENLDKWINGKEFDFCCYAKPEQIDGFYYYDFVVLRMALANHFENYMNKPPFVCNSKLDVYNLSKNADKLGYFNAIRNEASNRKSFKQENVYKALFGSTYESHDAYHDVQAMIKIYYELDYRMKNNVCDRDQMKLI